MKNVKRLVLSAVICGGLVLSRGVSLGNQVYASGVSDYQVVRLGGSDRFDTAIEISKEFVKTSKTPVVNCIIGRCDTYGDSISVGPFAVYKNAPMLLTEKKTLNKKTEARLKAMKVKNVYIVGAEGVVSANVEKRLKSLGYVVTRIGGKDRIATNRLLMKQVPKELWGRETYIIDDLDWIQGVTISRVVRDNDYNGKMVINPIFLASAKDTTPEDFQYIADEVNPVMKEWTKKGKSSEVNINEGNRLAIIKKSGVGKEYTESIMTIKGIFETKESRVQFGLNNLEYEQSQNVGVWKAPAPLDKNLVNALMNHYTCGSGFYGSKGDRVLTTGANFVDALAVVPFASREGSPVVLADKTYFDISGKVPGTNSTRMTGCVSGAGKCYMLGGESAMPSHRIAFLTGK